MWVCGGVSISQHVRPRKVTFQAALLDTLDKSMPRMSLPAASGAEGHLAEVCSKSSRMGQTPIANGWLQGTILSLGRTLRIPFMLEERLAQCVSFAWTVSFGFVTCSLELEQASPALRHTSRVHASGSVNIAISQCSAGDIMSPWDLAKGQTCASLLSLALLL